MDVGGVVRRARRRAGLTQRELAAQTGIAQPTIARIERDVDDPRISTVARLLDACGEELDAIPRRGDGIDASLIDELLALEPADRVRRLAGEADALRRLDGVARRRKR